MPVVGAEVSAKGLGGATVVTTDALGTFAIYGEGIASVTVRCRYCRTLDVPVASGEPVVAIVLRYDALAHDAPSSRDLANLPYAQVESAVALRPFTLLASSTKPYPGSQLSDRGLSSTGSLSIDDGVPNYDIVTGASPYRTIPEDFEQSADIEDASNAFTYGNRAGGGVVELDPFEGEPSQAALGGSDVVARAQIGTPAAQAVIGSFTNDEQSQQRADGSAQVVLPADQAISIVAGSEQGRSYAAPGAQFSDAFSFGSAAFRDPRAANLSISAITDRGASDNEYDGNGVGTLWSDTQFGASVRTNGPVAAFADLASRLSTGLYDAPQLERIGASLQQFRTDAGVDAEGTLYSLQAGIGAYWIDYAGGSYGTSQAAKTALATPAVAATLWPQSKWSVDLQSGSSFTLPTFTQQFYRENDAVAYSRNTLWAGALNYTDQTRLKLSLEAATQNVAGATTGIVTSAGLAATWQIAPLISLRAWTMHVTDTAPEYGGPATPYGGVEPTVGALWVTYDNTGAIRIDAIYRRDLLDGSAFYHLDGAISGPIARGLRWYASAEDRMHRTFVDAGLRRSF
jgi:hypothetical protein